jgi:SAM-dependent methyltransferase
MIMKKEELINNFLCCPCQLHSELSLNSHGEIMCTTATCPREKKHFINTSNQPVLVNFENSVFKQENYLVKENGSVLNRKRSYIHKILRDIVWGKNKITQVNSKIFIDKLLDINPKPVLLMVGGGTKGVGSDNLYENKNITIVSFDVYASEYTNFIADAHSIPIKSESIDGVWIQAVLEHVLEPAKVADEIHRILKPKGIVYAETPFVQQVHEKAYDFTRFTESGHRWLFKKFELIDSGSAAGPGMVLVWSIRYFFSGLFRSKKAGLLFGILFFWLRFLDNLIPENYSSDAAAGIFFMGKKSGSPIQYHEIIDFYKGTR